MTTQPTTILKAKLAERRALLVPGVPNALSALIAADLGYEAVYVTGAGVTNMSLGMPDLGLITLSELAEVVRAIRDMVALPIIVDADTGFGNAVNVHRTVKVLERAGASAIQLEDQVFPKKCGHFAGKDVIPLDEMLPKIRAAVDARQDGDLLIVARTDARAVLGLNAAIERAASFIEAGADVTFVEAPESIEEMRAIPARLPAVPQLANLVVGGKTPVLPQAELQRMGFAVALYANVALQSAVKAMQGVLSALLRDGALDAVRDQVATFAERQRLVQKPMFDDLEQKYRS
jgi:2-methylisocitrate lyase-like PEP mutase family enzyme